MKRAFTLPENDCEFLESRGSVWETIIEEQGRRQQRWVLIEGFDVPEGYNHHVVDVALLLHASYPDVQIDMAYFLPALARADGRQIRQLSCVTIGGKSWQRWSRHRPNPNTWRPGIDNIETHLLFVTAFLEQELRKP